MGILKFLAIFVFLNTVAVPQVYSEQIKYYSFEFNECNLADALKEIAKKSGVEISAPFQELKSKSLNKQYSNSQIDEIIQDMFQGQNYAMVWYYKDNQLVSLDIQLSDHLKSNGKNLDRPSAGTLMSNNSKTVSKTQPAIHSKSSRLDSPKEQFTNNTQAIDKKTVPPSPDPNKFGWLERPPTPPGVPEIVSLSNNK